jgi:hypothetical protein
MILISQYIIFAVIGLNAVSAIRRCMRDKTFAAKGMATGNICVVVGFLILQFSSHSVAAGSNDSESIVLEPSGWEIPARVMLIIGLLLFSAAYAVDSFKPVKNEN